MEENDEMKKSIIQELLKKEWKIQEAKYQPGSVQINNGQIIGYTPHKLTITAMMKHKPVKNKKENGED